MIVGLYQCVAPAGDISAGLALIDTALAEAKAAGVDMLTMPELILPGYNAGVAGVALPPGTVDQVAARVAQHGVALTVGMLEEADGKTYNSAYTFDRTGDIIAQFRKIQLFGPTEAQAFTSGDSYVTFDFEGKRFGVLICYDVEFPEHVRALVDRGANIILAPTANMMPYVNVPQIMVPARAMENSVTLVYANLCGHDGAMEFTGLSGIFGPDGYILGGKGRNPGLCLAEVPQDWSEHGIPLGTHATDLKKIAP